MDKFKKALKNALKELMGDYVIASILCLCGVILLFIGIYAWVPLVVIGVAFIAAGLFVAGLL